jgi:hypothetical protein
MGGGEQIPSLDSAGVALYTHNLHFWELGATSPRGVQGSGQTAGLWRTAVGRGAGSSSYHRIASGGSTAPRSRELGAFLLHTSRFRTAQGFNTRDSALGCWLSLCASCFMARIELEDRRQWVFREVSTCAAMLRFSEEENRERQNDVVPISTRK